MKTLRKLRRFSYTILFLSFVLLFTANSVAAKYFNSNLSQFVKTEHQITVPIFEPSEKIELSIEENTVISAAGSEDLKLENGERYFVSQMQFKPETKVVFERIESKKSSVPDEKAEINKNLGSAWGVQILASSTEKNALALKEEVKSELEAEILILKEDELFKLVIGSFAERKQAEKLQQELKNKGYNGWPRQVELSSKGSELESGTQKSEFETATESKEQLQVVKNKDSDKKSLILYNNEGQKLREAYVFEIKGQFKADNKSLQGKFSFGPLGNSVLFSYKTELEELTAYLLQNNLKPDAPMPALKAQAVIYRTSLLYQLEIQGARLENLNDLKFDSLNSVFKEAAELTKAEVLTRAEQFYYNTDYSLREIRKPKTGTVSLAKADYSYQEILNYYYERSQIKKLTDLLDSEEKFTARVARGLYFKEIRQMSWSGPRLLTLLDYDLSNNNLQLQPVLARDIVPGREDLADLIKKHSALAGVNGGYFNYSGRPLGLLYIQGNLVSEPLHNRSAILITQDNQLSFSQVDWEGEVLINSASEKIKIDGINREVNSAEVVLFNHFYGHRMPPLDRKHYDIVVRDGKILGVENKKGSQTPIPPDGFILRLSALRSEIKNMIPELKGADISLNYNLSPDFKEKNILHAVGGGPRLLKNGKIAINGQEENFQNDILNGRAPRTAAALTSNNHLLFLTIDGRQSNLSVGMTLKELAQTLKGLGAVDALNLDGGGSARMVVRGFTMSSPSEKRLISNGVIVDEKEEK